MREDAERKALRLLTSGRLVVELVDTERIRATVRGDSGQVYVVGYSPGPGWTCACPALNRCSHLLALQRVTLVPSPRRWAEPIPMRTGGEG
jgi:hypothetical protein